ncbi:MAG TPA: thioesterase family protein [Caulobacteraceae bacterium]|nr:thioesterase family protein [Caulobacteraceae bacterium]
MRTFDTADVLASEIDHLGHMNVRFYAERSQRANSALLAELGLDPDMGADRGVRLTQTDSYTRYQREQFAGATLVVRGGVLGADALGVRTYYELANPAKDEIAATFLITTALTDRTTGEVSALPEAVVAHANARRIELPAHGRPRTIDMGPPRTDLDFQDVAARVTEDPDDHMSRRSDWTVPPEACDEHGVLADVGMMMFGGFRPPTPDEMKRFGPMTFETEEGHRVGWASLETRMVRVSPARAGDQLCSIGAEIGLHSKVRHTRRWLFNTTTGRLVTLNDNVNIALDLDARRAIDIPPSLRKSIEARHTPEFA